LLVIKKLLKDLVAGSVRLSRKTALGRYRHDIIVDSAMRESVVVSHGAQRMRLAAPNWLCRFRAATFSTKEPETLEWIDSLPQGAVLWDVGANVGLYAVYAAKHRNSKVFAFEPSVFNLELLARNAQLNDVSDRVCIVPLALSDTNGPSQLRMTSTDWGGALSTFGRDFGWDGKAIAQVFAFQTYGLTMDDAVQRLGLPQPDFIKMDVDGIEHIILGGGNAVLRAVRGVLIEINDGFKEQAERSSQLLTAAGLQFVAKRHSSILESSTEGFERTFNQIWIRP
jgi:FkbM family methyltransferase